MRKLGIAMFLLPVLAGCAASSTDGPSRPGPVPGAARPDVEWHAARVGDEIVVELIDRRGYYRVERVELVGPAGRTIRAHDLARETVRDSARGYSGGGGAVGGGYGSGGHGGLGLGFSIPLTVPRHEGGDHADDGAPQAARRLPAQGRAVGHKDRSDRPGGNRAFRRHPAALSGQTRSISTPSDRILILNSGNADLGKIGMTRPWSLNFGVTTITASSAAGGSLKPTRFTQTSP